MELSKVVVGILPCSKMGDTEGAYNNYYKFLDIYSNKIVELGAIPIGLIANQERIDSEQLKLCDALLLQGGNTIEKYHYEALIYAFKNNIPVLGICMGMQAIGIFSLILDHLDENKLNIDNFYQKYLELKQINNGSLLKKNEIPNHGENIVNNPNVTANINNIHTVRHKVKILDVDSICYDIFRSKYLNVVSLHSYSLKGVGKLFKVGAYALDNVIEEVECIKEDYFILGVQWHPEWDDNNLLFKRLIQEAIKRKNNSYGK